MNFHVFIISDAETDIFELYHYVKLNDSEQKADYIYGKIQEVCDSLTVTPERGHIPPELTKVGVFDFREIHFKPYRIIYQIIGTKIFVHCVLHGKRDLQELLEKRLLR
jgi:toxin ParE1/3/4